MSFATELTREIVESLANDYSGDNHDPNRFGPLSAKSRFAGVAFKGLSKFGLHRLPIGGLTEFFSTAEPLFEGLTELHGQLEDEASKDLLVKVLAYRALGFRKVKLPLNTPEYWEQLEHMKARCDRRDTIDIPQFKFALHRLNLSESGFPLELYATPLGAQAVFVTRQYEYRSADVHIKAEPGDVVIDAGGCWGDTALYFAHVTAPEGRVLCFEFIPSNLDIFRKNLNLNAELKGRIEIEDYAVWNESDLVVSFRDRGPASRVVLGDGEDLEGRTETLSIDDLVERRGLESVDFIKMDIEGAEPQALQGAESTIRRFQPKLAISVYHRLSDFVDVFRLIRSFAPGYRYYLGHSTIYGEETVLFAVHD